MGDSNDFSNFELILKKNSVKRPSAIYNASTIENNLTIKPQDVLDKVFSQIKTLQLADGRNSKSVCKDLKREKTSDFLTVAQLPVYSEVLNPMNEFETQWFSDSQLLDIISNAEALIDTNKGMTQEFDITFSHNVDKNCSDTSSHDKPGVEKQNYDTQEFETTFSQTNVDKTVVPARHDRDGMSQFDKTDYTRLDCAVKMGTEELCSKNVDTSKVICVKALDDNETTAVNVLVIDKPYRENDHKDILCNFEEHDINLFGKEDRTTTDDIEEDDLHTENLNNSREIDKMEAGPSSPIFKLKTNIKKQKQREFPQLVVSLECFEKFEKLALQLIDSVDISSIDTDTSKDLIYSQILKEELALRDDAVLFNNNDQSCSILDKSGEIFHDSAKKKLVTYLDDKKGKSPKQNDSFNDEIIFSSDEEYNYVHREFKDVKLKALETPMYYHSNVLEETMYDGLYKASKRSAQMSTDSFIKAEYTNEIVNCTNVSSTQLFELCDEKNSSNLSSTELKVLEPMNPKTNTAEAKQVLNKDDIAKVTFTEPNKEQERIEDHTIKVCTVTDYNDTIKKPPEKIRFIGFTTASNNQIDLSDKALELSKKVKVLMNVELEDLGNLEPIKGTNIVVKDDIVTNPDKKDSEYDIVDNINDDLIIQEFENIEMPLDEKEASCKDNSINFQGFKTDSNRIIDSISDAAKAKIRDVFQDIDLADINKKSENVYLLKSKINENSEIMFSPATETFIGFKTANNKNIKVSAQALAKTKNLFQDIDKPFDDLALTNDTIQTVDYLNQPSTSKAAAIGFKTANKKDSKIYDIAMSKSSKLFIDIDHEINKGFQNELEKPNNFFKVITNASTKSDNISNLTIVNTKDLTNNFKHNASLSSFEIADDKAAPTRSIARSKKLFDDLGTDIKPNSLNSQPYETTPNYQNHSFLGFQTASRKPVSVTAHALEKSKKVFQDIEHVSNMNTVNKEVANTLNANEKYFNKFQIVKPSCIVGFKPASNKNVNISKEAQATLKQIFDNFDDNEILSKSKEIHKQPFGFQTTNNKPVEISKEAVDKVKHLFNDMEVSEFEEPLSFLGFQTASKKKIEVSKEALHKTKSFFNDIEITDIKEQETTKGVQNTSKKLGLSKEKTKSYLDDKEVMGLSKNAFIQITMTNQVDENYDSDKIETKTDVKSMLSFQTASNKRITVSEDALKTSKKLLGDPKDTEKKSSYSCDMNMNSTQGRKIRTDLDKIMNTQVLDNFEDSLHTEDFSETPRKFKRSGSPILYCPNAKKRKQFKTLHKDETNKKSEDALKTTVNSSKFTINIKFNDDYKKNKIYMLKDLTKFAVKRKNKDPYISNFNLDNILNFEFETERNELADTKISLYEIKNIFLGAVNKTFVPEGWLDNHLKLIMWKLISYEIKFSSLLCTVQNVIDQLKYRYNKELYNAERSALRKIFERDDVSSKTMVLCVADVLLDGVSVNSVTTTENIELLLTDGWYFVKATIDKMLSKLVYDGRIVVGKKIVTSGAELSNCEQGKAPWEDTTAVRLKLFGNSTRPARWYTKLGYTRAVILNQLSTVKVDGGKIDRLRVFVTRVYPLLYVEKFEDGSTVTRSDRLEHLHQMKYETERELVLERIYDEVQREFSDQESQDSETLGSGKRKCYDSGSQIAKMMKLSKDPIEFKAELTPSQVQLLERHTSKCKEKMIEAIQTRIEDEVPKRNVITLARGRIADVKDDGTYTTGMLSIWKPNDEILELFKEGAWIEIINVVPTAIRYSEIQITAGRQSVFKPTKRIYKPPSVLQTVKRKCYKISDVAQNPTLTTDYNEIDTVGIVFLIEPDNREFESNNFQNIYLADPDKNLISLNFWGGMKKFGFENIIDTGDIIVCVNLQKRAGNTLKNIPQFRVTEFSNFTKTPKSDQAREIVDNINKKLLGRDRKKFCEDCIAIRNNYTAIRCLNNFETESPYRFNKADYSFTRNRMFIDTPIGLKPNKKEDVNLNLTGLDFESTFKQDTQEISPETMQRKKKVNEKIAKLKMYGEPPPLNQITIINKSVNAKNSYKSPLILKNTSISIQNNISRNYAAINNNFPENSPKTSGLSRSPILSMKRSYGRSVPVILNFEGEKENDVDHFAEEFDGSPPMSLD